MESNRKLIGSRPEVDRKLTGSSPEVDLKLTGNLKMIPLRLPMTKGVVKCLDTVETFLQENLNIPKDSFIIFLIG